MSGEREREKGGGVQESNFRSNEYDIPRGCVVAPEVGKGDRRSGIQGRVGGFSGELLRTKPKPI